MVNQSARADIKQECSSALGKIKEANLLFSADGVF